MAFALLAAQTLALIAGMALFGQLVVGIFNWRGRQNNVVYQMFQVIGSPVVKLIRFITPKVVLDRHIPVAAFMVLVFGYFWLGFEHRSVCRVDTAQAGCEKWAAAWSGGAVRQ